MDKLREKEEGPDDSHIHLFSRFWSFCHRRSNRHCLFKHYDARAGMERIFFIYLHKSRMLFITNRAFTNVGKLILPLPRRVMDKKG
jgi:hypothetical protein